MVRHKKEKLSYNENMKKRNQYTPEFKTKVVLEVLREEGTINEIAARYELSPSSLAIGRPSF